MGLPAEGIAVQRRIEARAAAGIPVCPNGCGQPYHEVHGHLAAGKFVTDAELACVAAVAEEAKERRRGLVELGQSRRQAVAFWVSLLVLAVVLAAMVSWSGPPVGDASTSSASVVAP